jgi:hypothetical protein
MAFTLAEIVPWGRSFDEYVRMFSLTDDDLRSRILGCGDGPASFNAVMRSKGRQVISVYPLYQLGADEIRRGIEAVYPRMMEQLAASRAAYVWREMATPEACGRIRLEAMAAFLQDFEQGKREGRYRAHELPCLPFGDRRFELALCSHLLFTYSSQLSADSHCGAVLEMCRVAAEVRVFPLLDLGGEPSPHVGPVCRCLGEHGYLFETTAVDYEFQRGGNRMLRAWRGEG